MWSFIISQVGQKCLCCCCLLTLPGKLQKKKPWDTFEERLQQKLAKTQVIFWSVSCYCSFSKKLWWLRVKIRPDKSIRWNLMNIWMLKMTKLFLVLVSVPSFLGSCLCTSCEDHWCMWVSFSTMCFIFMEL